MSIVIIHPQLGELWKSWLRGHYDVIALSSIDELVPALEARPGYAPDLYVVAADVTPGTHDDLKLAVDLAALRQPVCVVSDEPKRYSRRGFVTYLTPVGSAQLLAIVRQMREG